MLLKKWFLYRVCVCETSASSSASESVSLGSSICSPSSYQIIARSPNDNARDRSFNHSRFMRISRYQYTRRSTTLI
ncbi:hypothetical protein BDR07DRAFT_1418194, partial [Suillus spraguei]